MFCLLPLSCSSRFLASSFRSSQKRIFSLAFFLHGTQVTFSISVYETAFHFILFWFLALKQHIGKASSCAKAWTLRTALIMSLLVYLANTKLRFKKIKVKQKISHWEIFYSS